MTRHRSSSRDQGSPARGPTSSSLRRWPTSARASSSIGSIHSRRTAPPGGSREEFLAFCAAVGFGRLAAEGNPRVMVTLRKLASDPRWRVREGVALGLQRLGASDIQALLTEMQGWATGERLGAASRSGGALRVRPATARERRPRGPRDPRLDHRGPQPFGRATERGVRSAPQGARLLLERGRRRGARRHHRQNRAWERPRSLPSRSDSSARPADRPPPASGIVMVACRRIARTSG
jgi:hypothetical protein